MKTKPITNIMADTRLSYQRINPAAMPRLYPLAKPTIIRIPAIRSPHFDTKRSLIHQLAINHPDATVQQMADLISTLSLPNIRLI